jgi:hypothetical protein
MVKNRQVKKWVQTVVCRNRHRNFNRLNSEQFRFLDYRSLCRAVQTREWKRPTPSWFTLCLTTFAALSDVKIFSLKLEVLENTRIILNLDCL